MSMPWQKRKQGPNDWHFPGFFREFIWIVCFFVLSNKIVRCLSGKNLGLLNGKFWAGVGNENNVFVCWYLSVGVSHWRNKFKQQTFCIEKPYLYSYTFELGKVTHDGIELRARGKGVKYPSCRRVEFFDTFATYASFHKYFVKFLLEKLWYENCFLHFLFSYWFIR